MYLDAVYALQRFRYEVIGAARRVWEKQVRDLAIAMGVQAPSGPSQLYLVPKQDELDYNGRQAWIAVGARFSKPVSARCYIGLSFDRTEPGRQTQAHATLMYLDVSRRMLDLWQSNFPHRDYRYWNCDPGGPREIGFNLQLLELYTVQQGMENIFSRAIEFWKQVGGWPESEAALNGA